MFKVKFGKNDDFIVMEDGEEVNEGEGEDVFEGKEVEYDFGVDFEVFVG